ncbi:MAG: S53 family peptidase, partial [Opitutaceae bacterium]
MSGSSIAAGRRLLSGHVPHAVTSGKASSLGRLPATQNLKLAIGLALRDQAGLEEFLRELNDPSSPNYHQYLTVQEFTDQFAPTAADYQAVVDYAIANGLTVTGTSSNRLVVNAEGPVANIEQAFQVTMGSYQHPTENRAFRAPANEPTIPVGLQILHISGLDNFALPHPVNINVSPLGQLQPETSYTGSGPTGLFIGNDFRAAYAPGVTLTGSGQSVALVEFQPYVLADVTAYFKQAGLPLNVPITNVLLDGATGVYTSASGADAEAVLDIDMAIDMAPGLSQVLVYEGDPNNVIPMDVMNRIATDNIAKQISSSWMWTYDPAETQVFMEFAAQGQTYLNASGDDGAYDIFYDGQVSYCFPSEDQYVTAVGGTSLATNGAGGPWQSEVCWSVLSGGGISPDNMPIPSYQQGISSSYNQASTTLRNVPDVSANADQNMFIVFTSDGTTVTGSIGGTSAATPIWAGFIALANQQAAKNGLGSVGFLNPSVYAIGKGSNYAKDFHDITVGSNVDVQDDFNLTNYNAGTGYDLVTGWGSPTGQNLINALAGTAGSAVDFTLWSAQESMTVALGSTNTDAITVNPLFGFAGSVSLSVSGLPSGVTASFSPSSTTGTSTLTLSAATSAKTGTFALTVTGKSGGLAHTVAINLIVPSKSPDFSLTLPQNTMAIWPGEDDSESTWFFVYVNDLYGFTGNVKLSLSGLPKGVTVSYQPSSTATSLVPWSCLYLTAASSATPGTYTVTVNGASGSLTHAVTFALTITPPDFSLALIPGSISMTPGSKVSSQ